jgi:hypothetical protein
MTVSYTNPLSLLGKEISFTVLLKDELKQFFSDPIIEHGLVEAVLVDLIGKHEILVKDNFYSLDEIEIA